jgi:hypothetical protein
MKKHRSNSVVRPDLSEQESNAATAATDTSHDNGGASASGAAVGPKVNVLDLVLALIEDHVAITDAERMTAALWVLHTWVREGTAWSCGSSLSDSGLATRWW